MILHVHETCVLFWGSC